MWWEESAGAPIPGVVEEPAAPERVLPPGGGVEEAGVGAVEAVQAVLRVAGGVAVDHVQQDHDAQGVRHVDQPLQLLGGPETTAGEDGGATFQPTSRTKVSPRTVLGTFPCVPF